MRRSPRRCGPPSTAMPEPRPAPSVVIGTAGHIDHGKTTLLRALTGIDADRLPEERRRGMTIDVGYAHLTLDDGSTIDFVDVPGHDRLVGNMLVGAGEIDAAMLVVAADDGPNAQTLEHLGLLDALGIRDALVVVTKSDLADGARIEAVAAEVKILLATTTLAGAPVLAASATTGDGVEEVRAAIDSLAARAAARLGDGRAPRLAIDRSFTVKGRGTVLTGSLRGGPVGAGMTMRLVPGDRGVRIREVQVRGATVTEAVGGRTALLIAATDGDVPRRGQVLTTDAGVVATSRLLVALRGPASGAGPADRERLRLHLGTDQVGALVVRGPREAIDLANGTSIAILRLDATIAVAPGDRFALRRPSPGSVAGGGVVLDAAPPRGVSRRRLTAERAGALTTAPIGSIDARIELHGALLADSAWRLAPDVEAALRDRAVALVAAHHAAQPESAGLPSASLRAELAPAARRLATLTRDAAAAIAVAVVDRLVADGMLARDGDRIRASNRAAGLPAPTLEAMDRLEAALVRRGTAGARRRRPGPPAVRPTASAPSRRPGGSFASRTTSRGPRRPTGTSSAARCPWPRPGR